MTSNISATKAAARKKLIARIATAKKSADAGKKKAKGAKVLLRHAKQRFKDAKRAARKLRKTVKALKAELAALAARKPARKPTRRTRAVKVARKAVVATVQAPTEAAPLPVGNPPTDPTN